MQHKIAVQNNYQERIIGQIPAGALLSTVLAAEAIPAREIAFDRGGVTPFSNGDGLLRSSFCEEFRFS